MFKKFYFLKYEPTKISIFQLCFDFSKNDNTFERNEDCATVFLKWTDFSEAQEIKKQETLVRFSILSSKTRLCVLQQCPPLDLCKLDLLTGRIRLIIPNFHKLSSKNMCQTGHYHTFIFLPFFGFNLKFHNLYNSTPNFYLHSTYVGR